MAEIQDSRPMAATGQRPALSTITNFIGAVASLALVVGIAVWGYQLLVRDVSGVPVVRAVEGPMRVQPENPGGQQAQHQGLSVNNVAAEGGAGAPADRLVLAPAPLELTLEDAPVQPGAAPVTELAAQPAVATTSTEVELSDVEQLAARLAAGVEPLGELEPLSDAAPVTQEDVQAAVAAVTGVVPEVVTPEDVDVAAAVQGGLGRSLRPQLRPAELGVAQPVSLSVPQDSFRDVDPATIPAGTRLAQLGAYDSADTARNEWDKLQGRFGDYMTGKDRVVQKATSGGRTFYRLRAMGFADLSDARRFCSALVAENAECIPVVTR